VIREEAAATGVSFSGAWSIEGTFPATNLYGDEQLKNDAWTGTLELDGYDERLAIGFEFVSKDDVIAWQKTGNQWSSVEEYEMKDTAERLAASMFNVAVFYDPGENWANYNFDILSEDYETRAAYNEEYAAREHERMIEDLRLQVRDFLCWLAAERII